MNRLDCDTAKDFVRELLEYVSGKHRPSDRPYSNYIFRGHADAAWPLIASIHRSPAKIAKIAFRTAFVQPQTPEQRLSYLGAHIDVEMDNLVAFLETADKIGLTTPINYEHFKGRYEHVFALWDASKRGTGEQGPLDQPFPEPLLLQAFALAQHYGVPTRLLDWTESPLAAAFFAAFELSTVSLKDWNGQRPQRLAVTALFAPLLEDQSSVRIVNTPRYSNSFLRAQRGLQTLIETSNHQFYDTGSWPTIETAAGDDRLCRITLPADQADELLRILYGFDVTPHHLRPSLTEAANASSYRDKLFGLLPRWAVQS